MTRGFAAALREELDFRIEARNIAAVAGSSRVGVPAVYGQWSTSRVLVMEYLDGVAVRHAVPVLAASGADRHGLARGLLVSHVYPAPGCYHADFPCRAGFTAHCGPTATPTARPWPEAMTCAPVPSRLASTIVPA